MDGVVLLLLVGLIFASQGQAKTDVAATGQELADLAAAWARQTEGLNETILLPPFTSLANVVLANYSNSPSNASSGTLTLQPQDPSQPAIIDTAFRFLVTPIPKGGFVHLDQVTFLNLCDVPVKTPGTVIYVGSYIVAFPVNPAYVGHTWTRLVMYLRQSDVMLGAYFLMLGSTPFEQVHELTQPLMGQAIRGRANTSYVRKHTLQYSGRNAYTQATDVQYRSIDNPTDPLLQTLRANGTLREPQLCTGAPLPDNLAHAPISSAAPIWVADTQADFLDAMRQAFDFSVSPFNTSWKGPAAVVLNTEVALDQASLQDLPPLNASMLLLGPFNDVPAYAVPCVVDWGGQAGVVTLAPGGTIFIERMTFKGLPVQPLPLPPAQLNGAAPASSSLPLGVFTTPSGPLAFASPTAQPLVWMSNVTLYLPPEDYVALASLALSSDSGGSSSSCTGLLEGTPAHAAQLQQGLSQVVIADGTYGPQSQSLVLARLVGWGINGSYVVILPTSPTPLPTCTPASSSSKHKLATGAVIGIVVGVVVLVLVALVALGAAAVLAQRRRAQQGKAQQGSGGAEAKQLEIKVVDPVLYSQTASPKGAEATEEVQNGSYATTTTKTGTGTTTGNPSSTGGISGLQDSGTNTGSSQATSFYSLDSRAGLLHGQGGLVPGSQLGSLSSQLHAAVAQAQQSMLDGLPYSDKAVATALSMQAGTELLASKVGVQAADGTLEPMKGGFSVGVQMPGRLPQDQAAKPPALRRETGAEQEGEGEGGSNGGGPTAPVPGSPGPSTVTSAASDPAAAVRSIARELNSAASEVTITEVLGSGASGTVYKGVWRGLPVALKTIVFDAGRELEQSRSGSIAGGNRAIMEAAICASVGHRNVVCTYLYDIKPISAVHSTNDGGLQVVLADEEMQAMEHHNSAYKLFLVQELCSMTLSGVISQLGVLQDPKTGRVDTGSLYTLLIDIARGLEYLHSKGIIHGDLKPANVLVKLDTSVPQGIVAKLGDFGLSTKVAADATHVSNFASGTPFYVAPEVVQQHRVSPASDVYSFGVVMWQLYTGMAPYVRHSDGQYAVNPQFLQHTGKAPPPTLYVQVVHRCMQQSPRDRPTATQLVQYLQTAWQAHSHSSPTPVLAT